MNLSERRTLEVWTRQIPMSGEAPRPEWKAPHHYTPASVNPQKLHIVSEALSAKAFIFVSRPADTKASFQRLGVSCSGVLKNCIISIALLKALWITVIVRVSFLFLSSFLLFHKSVLIQKFLAIAHFNPRVPSEAPVPARCQFLVRVVSTLNVAVCNIGTSWHWWISVDTNRICWREARRFFSLVCGWRSWLKSGIRRGRHDW